jgi:glycosyltransferase involved in cell wall biosynthesis
LTRPLVSVIVPALDEEEDIAGCLAAVLAQTYPNRWTEVIVVDGGSVDGTVERATATMAEASGLANWQVVHNHRGSTPSNLNFGLALAEGEFLCRVDARSVIPSDYIERCVAVLDHRRDVAVVGGAQVARARTQASVDLGVARALNNRWGMGLARYRRGSSSGPTDTVYLGAFRMADLREQGGWNEKLPTNQDYELNRRMGERGVVWFEEDLEVGYLPRQSLRSLFAQYRRFGRWKVRYWRMTGERPASRQLVLLSVPFVAVAGGVAWLVSVPRPVRRGVAIGAALAAGFEVGGSNDPAAPVPAHVVSFAASVMIAVGWLSGVWSELWAGHQSDG